MCCVQELRDRNDELSSELELLKSHRSDRKSRRPAGDAAAALNWTEQQRPASTESDSGNTTTTTLHNNTALLGINMWVLSVLPSELQCRRI